MGCLQGGNVCGEQSIQMPHSQYKFIFRAGLNEVEYNTICTTMIRSVYLRQPTAVLDERRASLLRPNTVYSACPQKNVFPSLTPH